MKVTLKQAFSILDGRLSTEMGDIYKMLNYIYSSELMTHQLPTAMRRLKELNPEWFSVASDLIEHIKEINETNDFEELMKLIDKDYSMFEIELGKVNEEIGVLAGLEGL